MTRISVAEPWWRPFGNIDKTAVIHVDLTAHARREAAAWAWLDEQEQERWHRYLHVGARRRFALCRAALRVMLCDRLGCGNEQLTFGTSEYGKPFALVQGTPAAISFNVTHSGQHGLIALAPSGRLGVDIEEHATRRDLDRLITTVLGPGEQAELASARGYRKLHQFFRLWTLKEALIKALGLGFSLDPSRFEIPSAMRHGAKTSIFRFPHLPAINWRLENLGTEHFAAAIAHEMGRKRSPERPAVR